MTHQKDNAEQGQAPWREHVDALLDEALSDTFPASDPVAIDVTPPSKVPQVPGSDRSTRG